MKLAPPVEQYLRGPKPTHSSRKNLAVHLKVFKEEEITQALTRGGYLSDTGKPTKKAAQYGVVDICEGKALWNLSVVKKTLITLTRPELKRSGPTAPLMTAPVRTGPAWVDLDTIGTYFGVGKIQIGKWLDELGLRAVPEVPTNDEGAVDMLDMANQAKEKQAAGFLGKKPTEKAYANGYAKLDVIEYTKKGKEKSFEKITWNLDKVKAILVKAGHPLDTERKLALKGKGKNSDVKVSSIDDRARELHAKWQKLYKNPATKRESWQIFKSQPTALITRVEAMMGAPGFITKRKYLTEDL